MEFDSKVLRIQLEVILRIFPDEIEVGWCQIIDMYVKFWVQVNKFKG